MRHALARAQREAGNDEGRGSPRRRRSGERCADRDDETLWDGAAEPDVRGRLQARPQGRGPAWSSTTPRRCGAAAASPTASARSGCTRRHDRHRAPATTPAPRRFVSEAIGLYEKSSARPPAPGRPVQRARGVQAARRQVRRGAAAVRARRRARRARPRLRLTPTRRAAQQPRAQPRAAEPLRRGDRARCSASQAILESPSTPRTRWSGCCARTSAYVLQPSESTRR